MTERDSALVKVLRGLRRLQTDAVFHEVINPPVFTGIIPIEIRGVCCRHQVQTASGIRVLLRQKTRNGRDIPHQTGDIRESSPAEALQNISPAGIRDNEKCQIDMPLTVRGTGKGLAQQREVLQNSLHKRNSSQKQV